MVAVVVVEDVVEVVVVTTSVVPNEVYTDRDAIEQHTNEWGQWEYSRFMLRPITTKSTTKVQLFSYSRTGTCEIRLQVPVLYGVPETIRTSGPFLRREVLYPAELRGRLWTFQWYIRDSDAVQLLSES